MISKLCHLLRACFCLPSKHSRPSSPIRRASHYNSKLRANLGIPDPVDRPQPHEPHHLTDPPTPTAPGEPPHPHILSSGRFSTENSAVKFSTSNMSRGELRELFNLIHGTLEHLPYAICGLGAIVDHGFRGRKVSGISILCPIESKDNVRAWASTRGYQLHGDSIGITTPNGLIRRVRIKYLEFGFADLQLTRSSFSNAFVLSIVSLLDNVAAGHLENKRRGDERALTIIANDVFFILDIIASRHTKVNTRFLPTFLGEPFFADFTARYVDARPEMARAGIDVSSTLVKHRTALQLREHHELLGQYGMQGDVVPQAKGQFEYMRDLKNSKSVYTLREKEKDITDIPPVPQLPKPSHQHDGKNVRFLDPNMRPSQSKQKVKNTREPQVRTSGVSNLGRNLTVPKQPKKIDRPVTDWI
ncbi:hypothetical protein GQX73_g9932 [Xylaria multiplex]|uniref:Uncharacterized protein n=1 Tax=Xylaria multiplex TaxID=323545 RepID=A0A7C8IKX4_9PEZI|nr:hypothetical protein GQX73_g9932 [Xylaria multiplex]